MDLGARIVSALRWGAGVKFAGQLLTWAMTIVTIRLLAPEDYGLMAIALLFVNFLMLLNELGLGAVIVQKKDLDPEILRKIYGFIIFLNVILSLILFTAATPISSYFDEPRLESIIQVISVVIIIGAFEVVPVSLLERDINFKRKSLVYFAASIIQGLVILFLAYNGFGVWSLVYGNIVGTIVRVVGVNFVSPYLILPGLSFANMKGVFSFGGYVTAERSLWYVYNQADVFIVGKLLGNELLGIYSVAMHLASLVMHKTGGIIYEIAFPSFAKIQDDKERISRYFLKAVRLMSYFAFPIFFGIASVSNDLVLVLLGEKWIMAGNILAILSLVMPVRMISNLLPPALQGVGRPGMSVLNLLLATVIMPVCFIIGSHWELIGVSFAWLLAFPAVFILMLLKSKNIIGVSFKDFFRAISLPLLSSLLMLVIVIVLQLLIADYAVEWVRLCIAIVAGISVYAFLMVFVFKKRFAEVMELVRR